MRSSTGTGERDAAVSRGACASPSTRANEALLLCSSSTRIRIWSSGSVNCRRYSAAATTAPTPTAPRWCSQPPSSSTPATGTVYVTSTAGKNTVRRNSV